MLSPEEIRAKFGYFYQNVDYSEVDEIFVNMNSGWAGTTKALAAYTNVAVEANEGSKKRLDIVKKGILGEPVESLQFDAYRVRWDGVTPNQDFVIASHTYCKRLFIATAGSFHRWKFMPTVGRYVVEMLDGTQDAGLAQRWSWDRPNEGAAYGDLLSTLELRNF
ncbi:hypothetical protein DE146DRAFT_740850 [Phaeosphaeria sp. MPI-PUGE-AT-0046c]|nr:hypothetical protein DE146DRAFT_740850 [Phaeosphaeria sp. MPI-PUGE-AT-0046c]